MLYACLSLALAWWAAPASRAAELQFDVFLGYGGQPTGGGGVIHEVGWSTVGCEVHNPGPSFQAVFEIGPANLGTGQSHRLALELPANTRKRFVLPVFMGGSFASWNARLIDDDGRVRAEWSNLQPQAVAWESLLVGALPRTFGGLPTLPELTRDPTRSSQQPTVARLLPELLPDNPIALEGLDAIYLNSDRAPELKAAQATALVQWLFHGGHLIVALEDSVGLDASPWLKSLVPLDIGQSRAVQASEAIAPWGSRMTVDSATAPESNAIQALPGRTSGFAKYNPALLHASALHPAGHDSSTNNLDPEAIAVVDGAVAAGSALLRVEGAPLMIRAKRGRGVITLLTFSPEREPFRSWDRRDWFWARLLQLPPEWFRTPITTTYERINIDGLFGVLLDSRQIRAMPLAWLLLLLAVYLVVIGPIDRIILKRLRREMLTWITFPTYVVLFSLLIYYVGFRLRAGDTEWNELHVVDLLPADIASSWRGRTYASIYSPVSTRYPLASSLPNATLRGELLGYTHPGGDMTVLHRDQGFVAELVVPVWTSQLLVSDWQGSNSPPVSARLTGGPNQFRIHVENHLDRPLQELRLAFQGRIHELGEVGARGKVELSLAELPARALREFVFQNTTALVSSAQQRQFAFGADNQDWPGPGATVTAALSFTTHSSGGSGPRPPQLTTPPDLDCSWLVDRGDAVLLAWVPDYAPVPTIRQFETTRARQNTLFRLCLPLDPSPPSQP